MRMEALRQTNYVEIHRDSTGQDGLEHIRANRVIRAGCSSGCLRSLTAIYKLFMIAVTDFCS